jgi:starvation-inducible DNA-binding protein
MKNAAKKPTQITDGLAVLLANTYIVYVKTQNFHWNVTGLHFYAYHKMFEEQYQQLAAATDEIAERIRSLQTFAPGSLAAFLKLTTIKESSNDLNANAMLQELLSNHEAIIKQILDLIEIIKDLNDEVTLDLLIERKAEHDKISWMLRSHLV